MNTQRPQFDSHRFVKRLTMAGLSEEVAEILADEHTRPTAPGDVATKADLDAVKAVMATKKDLDAVKAVMATKEDLDAVIKAVMATKEDLDAVKAVMATKEDLDAVIKAVMATKEDLDAVKAVMATKEDLKVLERRLDAVEAVMVTKKDLAASEARMEQLLRNAILEAKISLVKWMIATTIATMAVFSGVVIGAMTATQ